MAHYILPNGSRMPALGLGTWLSKPEETRLAVETAISYGYRHIDTAYAYGNEKDVGEAIRNKIADGTIRRDEIFVVTKLWITQLQPNMVEGALDESLKNLGLEYVDLYLQHAPTGMKPVRTFLPNGNIDPSSFDPVPVEQTWKALEQLVHKGKAREIGVSNFNMSQLQRLLNVCTIKPATNQVESNLYVQQKELQQFCVANGIVMTAFAPLGSPGKNGSGAFSGGSEQGCLHDEVVAQLGAKYHKTNAQILLRFLIDSHKVVIPKSVTPSRIKENFDVFDFKLTDADMTLLQQRDKNEREFTFKTTPGITEHPEFPWK